VSAGPYENVREVLGLTSYYYAVTEELQCKGCKKRLLSWSKPILDQLDVAHRSQFPVLLTYKKVKMLALFFYILFSCYRSMYA